MTWSAILSSRQLRFHRGGSPGAARVYAVVRRPRARCSGEISLRRRSRKTYLSRRCPLASPIRSRSSPSPLQRGFVHRSTRRPARSNSRGPRSHARSRSSFVLRPAAARPSRRFSGASIGSWRRRVRGRAPLPSRLRFALKGWPSTSSETCEPRSSESQTWPRIGCDILIPDVAIRTGDTPRQDRVRFAKTPADILITTPESLYLILTSSARESLRSVETVIGR